MKKRKYLTIEDLLRFCQEHKLSTFDSKEQGFPIAVQIPTSFEIDNFNDDNHRGMLRLKFRVLHDGLNRNGSFVSKKSADNAAPTLADRPILAAIHQLDDGTWDFESHEMEIVENEDGEEEINYIEKQVGSFSSEKPFWEYDKELDKNYFCAYGYIPEDYTKAADIIRAKNGTKNSCELCIEKMAYNAKEKYLELEEFYFSGSTLLGSKDDGTPIGEGMLGSRADIADFSQDKNSIKFELDENLKQFIQASVQEALDNKNSKGKEENNQMNKFEELLQKYGKSVEDITFEYEGLDDEALEKAFAEAFDENGEPSATGNEGDNLEPEPEPTPEPEPEPKPEPDSTSDNFASFSVTINGETKTFSCSLVDKLNALYTLVNETYSESDNEWYDIDANEETKEVFMFGFFSGKNYKQKYSVKKDVFSLQGDRVEVFATYLTKDEQTQLESMKSNYSSISEKLAQYEAEPEKIELLNSEDYAQIKNTKEYAEISKRENYFSLTKEELVKKLDDTLLQYAKAGKLEFEEKPQEEKKRAYGFKPLPIKTKNSSKRYGTMFSKE